VAIDHRRELSPLLKGQDAGDLLVERSRECPLFSGRYGHRLRSLQNLVRVGIVAQELVQPVGCLDQPLDAPPSARETCPIEALDSLALNVSEPD